MIKGLQLLLVNLVAIYAFSQQTSTLRSNELIVKFKSSTYFDVENVFDKNVFDNDRLDALNTSQNIKSVKLTGNKTERNTYVLSFGEEHNVQDLIDLYQSTDLFEYVEPNFIGEGAGKQGMMQTTPDDTHFSRQYGLHNDGSFTLSPAVVDADIDMDLAWDIEQGSPDVVVAILDSGLKMDHPEFEGRIWENLEETINGIDDDNNGLIDDVGGWDFVNDDNDPTDDHGHGTNVTGILGANGNNNLGYAGVDWNSKLMICKVINENNFGFYSWWIDAIYYAVNNGANVINMSLGGSSISLAMREAVDYAFDNGVTIVASMMNEDNNVVFYPAAYQNTIAVGSTDPNDERSSPFFWDSASGSCFGGHIDVVAPGNFMYGLSYTSNTNYNSYWGGTSQATPLVAGLCALLLSQDYGRSPSDIRTIIRETAEDQVGDLSEDTFGFDIFYGYGRVNAYDALLQGDMTNNSNLGDEVNLNVFPNPASDVLFINGDTEYKSISIINMQGIELFEEKFSLSPDSFKIDISEFPSGSYLITIKGALDEMIMSQTIIKN